MNKTIDLQLNYPIVDGLGKLLKSTMEQALSDMADPIPVCKAGGDEEDRAVGAKWLSQPDYPLTFKNVFIGTGGHNSLITALLSARLINKVIATDEFTYSNFKSIAELLGLKIIPCAADEQGMMPSSLAEACKTAAVDAVYLMPTIHNPLGTVMPLPRREEIIAVARNKNLLIIEDDAYGFLADDILPSFFHLAPERSFYIYSFSKPLAQGIKTSYLLAPDLYAEQVIETSRLTGSTASTLLVATLRKLITSGALRSVIDAKKTEGSLRQWKATSLLSDYKVLGHKNGWHFWIPLPPSVQSARLGNILLERGVAVVSSNKFAVDETNHTQGIRVALGGEPDFDRVLEGIGIIREALLTHLIPA